VATTSVTVQDNSFGPAAIAVSAGATVTWTWSGSNPHNVTFTGGAMTNSTTKSSGTHSATAPSTAGTYHYTCTIHAGMDGSVTVQ